MEEKMSYVIEDDSVLVKYNGIWNKIKEILVIKFHNKPFYEKKDIRTKVKTFNGVVDTVFLGSKIPKERILYSCISVTIVGTPTALPY